MGGQKGKVADRGKRRKKGKLGWPTLVDVLQSEKVEKKKNKGGTGLRSHAWRPPVGSFSLA